MSRCYCKNTPQRPGPFWCKRLLQAYDSNVNTCKEEQNQKSQMKLPNIKKWYSRKKVTFEPATKQRFPTGKIWYCMIMIPIPYDKTFHIFFKKISIVHLLCNPCSYSSVHTGWILGGQSCFPSCSTSRCYTFTCKYFHKKTKKWKTKNFKLSPA